MNQLELKEKLANLKRDPLYRTILPHRVAKEWYKSKVICPHISSIIIKIMKDTYTPLGLWLQNPDTKGKRDFGVVYGIDWDLINYADTNYSSWVPIFNNTHRFFIDYCRMRDIKDVVVIYGEEFSINEDFSFTLDSLKNLNETKLKIRRFLILTYFLRNSIFHPESDTCKELLNIIEGTTKRGNEAEDFFETHINDVFDDIVTYKKTKGKGDYDDRKQGVDFWMTHQTSGSTLNVKSVSKIDDSNDNIYIIDVAISETSKCNYFAFIEGSQKILLFENDNTKIIRNVDNKGMGFPSELLRKKIVYNE